MKNKSRAFTLIELLVVVLIISILAAVAVPQYQLGVAKARYMQLITFANALRKGQVVYTLANGKPSADIRELAVSLPEGTSLSSSGNTIYYPWGLCQIGSTGYAFCESTRDGVLYNDLSSIHECKVKPGSNEDFGKRICKSFGTYKHIDGNGYFVYELK